MDQRMFYIGGEWVSPLAGTDHDVINPSTAQPAATISLGGQADTDAAVAAARAAAVDWGLSSPTDRKALLEAILAEYTKRSTDLAEAMSTEMGAPIDLAMSDQAGAGAWHLGGFIKAIDEIQFDRALGDDPVHRVLMKPIGVAALITPWNWPMNQVVLKVGGALAAGCTMVLKPSEVAPLSAMVFAEVLHEAGVPAGVFNLINGDGAGVGSQLTSHPDVDMVSFTGSTRAGVLISQNASTSVKRVALELGGKSPDLIFADADVEKAVRRTAGLVFENSGQSCNAPTRMLVERSVYDEAVQIAATVAQETAVGSAADRGAHIGPLVSAVQFDKVQDLIAAGINEGATVVAGGVGKPENSGDGYFVKPTVFSDVTPEMRVVREEIFGPVLTIAPFDTEDEAVELANDTEYGLSAYVHTADVDRARRLANRLRAGMIQYNGSSLAQGAPFGGVKMSGSGREGGVWGIEEFLEVTSISGIPS